MADEPKLTSEWTRKRTVRKIRPRDIDQAARRVFRSVLVGLTASADREPHQEEPVGGSGRRRSGLGEAAARCAQGVRQPPGCAADQGAALRRRFAEGGRPHGDRAVRESRAGAEPLPWRPCRPDATRSAGGAGGHRTDTAACAYAFAG